MAEVSFVRASDVIFAGRTQVGVAVVVIEACRLVIDLVGVDMRFGGDATSIRDVEKRQNGER